MIPAGKIAIRPTSSGAGLRDPDTRQLIPEHGAIVTDSQRWRRRIRNGHAELLTAAEWREIERRLKPPEPSPAPKQKAAEPKRPVPPQKFEASRKAAEPKTSDTKKGH